MRRLVTLLTVTALAAGLLAGCGDKPGVPSQVTVEETQNDATAQAANETPIIEQSALVRQALRNHPDYADQVARLEPKESQAEAAPSATGETGTTPATETPATETPATETPAVETPATPATEPATETAPATEEAPKDDAAGGME